MPAKDNSRSLRRLRVNGLRGVCQEYGEVSSGRKSLSLPHIFAINFFNLAVKGSDPQKHMAHRNGEWGDHVTLQAASDYVNILLFTLIQLFASSLS